jgi:hypothetical protein
MSVDAPIGYGGGELLQAELAECRVERDRLREALHLVENLHARVGDEGRIMRAVALHGLGRPDALGYLKSFGVDFALIDHDVQRFLVPLVSEGETDGR